MDHIKSATVVQQHVQGEWLVRIRFQTRADGVTPAEAFLGVGAGYTMHQAQAALQNSRYRKGLEMPLQAVPSL